MSVLSFELRLLLRARPMAAALLLLLLLSSLAVWSGWHEVARQRQTIARVGPLNEQDVAAVARARPNSPNGGDAAYYTFYTTEIGRAHV